MTRVVRPPHARRTWAALMLRSLLLDVLQCPKCPGRMKVISCIEQPEVIEKFLKSAGLWTESATAERRAATPASAFDEDSSIAKPPHFDRDWADDPPPDPSFD